MLIETATAGRIDRTPTPRRQEPDGRRAMRGYVPRPATMFLSAPVRVGVRTKRPTARTGTGATIASRRSAHDHRDGERTAVVAARLVLERNAVACARREDVRRRRSAGGTIPVAEHQLVPASAGGERRIGEQLGPCRPVGGSRPEAARRSGRTATRPPCRRSTTRSGRARPRARAAGGVSISGPWPRPWSTTAPTGANASA